MTSLVDLQVVRVGLSVAPTTEFAIPPTAIPPRGRRRPVLLDSLYRNSLMLILNYAAVGAIGFLFWAVAARMFPAAEIGNVTALFSGLSFISIAAGLGLQNTVVRYLAAERDQRSFLAAATTAVGVTTGLLMAVVLVVPGHFAIPVVGGAGAPTIVTVVAIAVLLTVGGIADAAIIGFRASGGLVVKNTIACILRIALLPFVVGAGEAGLLVCLLASITVATLASLVIALRRARRAERRERRNPLAALSGKLTFSAGNHVAMLLSVGPLFLLPIYVVNVLGPTSGAYLAACVNLMVALNAIPTTASQSLFAELGARPHERAALVARSFRTTYSLVIPAVAGVCVLAPVILGLFGTEYTAATTCLRLLAIGAVFGAFNYIADVVLNSAGRIAAFTRVNVVGALAVLGSAMLLGRHGLTWLGVGWLAGQILYSLFAAIELIRTGLLAQFRPGTHRTVPA